MSTFEPMSEEDIRNWLTNYQHGMPEDSRGWALAESMLVMMGLSLIHI